MQKKRQMPKLLKGQFNMAIASRGKTYSDKPGWALDPKTKLELKRRKETRELPAKFGGKVFDKEENDSKDEPDESKEKEERKKKKSREVVTSENREAYMAKKLKLANKQEPVYKED